MADTVQECASSNASTVSETSDASDRATGPAMQRLQPTQVLFSFDASRAVDSGRDNAQMNLSGIMSAMATGPCSKRTAKVVDEVILGDNFASVKGMRAALYEPPTSSCTDCSFMLDETMGYLSGQRGSEAALLFKGGRLGLPSSESAATRRDAAKQEACRDKDDGCRQLGIAAHIPHPPAHLQHMSWTSEATHAAQPLPVKLKRLSPRITGSVSLTSIKSEGEPEGNAKTTKRRLKDTAQFPRSKTICYCDGNPVCTVLCDLLGVNIGDASAVPPARGGGLDDRVQAIDEDPTPEELAEHAVRVGSPPCDCIEGGDRDSAPTYAQLGMAGSLPELRHLMEQRTGFAGKALRLEKLCYTDQPATTSLGCPAAKWVLRRSGDEEMALVCVRRRPEHVCPYTWMVVAVVLWEGVPKNAADHLYNYLSCSLPLYGIETTRVCETNKSRTCGCQGLDKYQRGASFSYGCSWCIYNDTCKFAKSEDNVSRFRMKEQCLEEAFEGKVHVLSQHLAPMFQKIAPTAYENQVKYEDVAKSCRLGFKKGRPFSGLTATMDYCAHAHRDLNNMNNGCTVLVTLTKEGATSEPTGDRQLHVLPCHALDDISDDVEDRYIEVSEDEEPVMEPNLDHVPLEDKIERGAVEVLSGHSIKVTRLKVARPKTNRKKPVRKKYDLKVRAVIKRSLAAVWQAGSTVSGCPPAISPDDTVGEASSSRAAGCRQRMPRPPSPEPAYRESSTAEEPCDRLFRSENLGGVGFDLTHGSVLFEVADLELHASTALRSPNCYSPNRMSLVFYQHRKLNYRLHGRFHSLKRSEAREENKLLEAGLGGKPEAPKSGKRKLQSVPKSTATKRKRGPKSTANKLQSGPENTTIKRKSGPTSSATKQKSGPTSTTIKRKSGPESTTIKRKIGPESTTIKRKIGPESTTIKRKSGPESTTIKRKRGPKSTAIKWKSGPENTTIKRKSGPKKPAVSLERQAAAKRRYKKTAKQSSHACASSEPIAFAEYRNCEEVPGAVPTVTQTTSTVAIASANIVTRMLVAGPYTHESLCDYERQRSNPGTPAVPPFSYER